MTVIFLAKILSISLSNTCLLELYFITLKNILLYLLTVLVLTLEAPSKLCSRRRSKIYIFYFSEKTSIDISCELQMIHMKCQDMFSSENKKK